MHQLVTIKDHKVMIRNYKTYKGLHKAQDKEIRNNTAFIAKVYENGEQYIYNYRTRLFDRVK